MDSRHNRPATTDTDCGCYCCPDCKIRMNRLEQMVNELFCLMSEYLPEELEGLRPANLTFAAQQIQGKVPRHYFNKQKQKAERKSAASHTVNQKSNNRGHEHLQKQSKQSQSNLQKTKAKKDFTIERKKQMVAKVQQAVRNGAKISTVCQQLGISDRSYQRWKMMLESGEEVQNSEDDVVILHSNF